MRSSFDRIGISFVLAFAASACSGAESRSGADAWDGAGVDCRPDQGDAVMASTVVCGMRCEHMADPIGLTTSAPRLSWMLDRVSPETRGDRQSAYQLLVASSPALLQADGGDLWDSGKVVSDTTLDVSYQGQTLAAWQRCFWKVRSWDGDDQPTPWSAVGEWTMGPLSVSDWAGASWIMNDGLPDPDALPVFRRAFSLSTLPARSLLAVTAMGAYEVLVNGRPVTEDVLSPGWTNYRKSVPFQVYDVSALLRVGDNVLAVRLGHGMDHIPGQRYAKFVGSFGPPKLLACLHLEQGGGAVANLVTDESWKTHASAITFSSIYGGEDFDARLELPGWSTPGFDDGAWAPAAATTGPGGALVARAAPPQRMMRELEPVAVTTLRPDLQVYDFGQNISGWPRITLEGAAGTAVKLIPGELLDGNGLVSQTSSGTPNWFTYVLAGAGQESWSPRFSFTGFRYLQVEGASGDKSGALVHQVRGQWIYSAAERTGAFKSSETQLNQIFSLVDAAFRNNLHSVLTDCPHREKLGWLETSHLLARSLMYDFDLAGFYTKVADDIAEAQTAEGLVPDIAPEYTVFSEGFRDSPEWGSAAVLVPSYAADVYGAGWLQRRHLDTMDRYLGYLRSREVNGLLAYGLGDWFDVGPGDPGVSQLTSLGLTASAIYYQDLLAAALVAERLGSSSQAGDYRQRAQRLRDDFNAAYFQVGSASYDRDSQTALAMPLAIGLVPDDQRVAVQARLVSRVAKDGFHVTAGDVGWVYVLRALQDMDRGDVILRLLLNPDGPGYLSQIHKGATALTESWDAVPIYSQDHAMLGEAHEWLYGGLAGIRSDGQDTGFQHIILWPQPASQVSWAEGSFTSAHGPIHSRWELRDGTFWWRVSLPPNVSATVHLPAPSADHVTERGAALQSAAGVTQIRVEGGRVVFELVSGSYDFAAPRAPEPPPAK